jgi:Fe-S cluster assembly iron-binding protein IscA
VTEDFVPTKENPISLTPEAVDQLAAVSESAGLDLRLVANVSCGGMEIQLGFGEQEVDDVVLAFEKFNLLLGPQTVVALFGTEISFVTNEQGESAFVFESPNAPAGGCDRCPESGCGSGNCGSGNCGE